MLPQLSNLLAELAKNQWPSILSLHFLMTSIFLVLLANFLPFLPIGHLESLLLPAVAFFPLLLAVTSSFTVAGDCSCASDPLACFSISSSIFHPAHSASSIFHLFSDYSLVFYCLSPTFCYFLVILKQMTSFHWMHYLSTVLLYILLKISACTLVLVSLQVNLSIVCQEVSWIHH